MKTRVKQGMNLSDLAREKTAEIWGVDKKILEVPTGSSPSLRASGAFDPIRRRIVKGPFCTEDTEEHEKRHSIICDLNAHLILRKLTSALDTEEPLIDLGVNEALANIGRYETTSFGYSYAQLSIIIQSIYEQGVVACVTCTDDIIEEAVEKTRVEVKKIGIFEQEAEKFFAVHGINGYLIMATLLQVPTAGNNIWITGRNLTLEGINLIQNRREAVLKYVEFANTVNPNENNKNKLHNELIRRSKYFTNIFSKICSYLEKKFGEDGDGKTKETESQARLQV